MIFDIRVILRLPGYAATASNGHARTDGNGLKDDFMERWNLILQGRPTGYSIGRIALSLWSDGRQRHRDGRQESD
jgi:hypothetical protein